MGREEDGRRSNVKVSKYVMVKCPLAPPSRYIMNKWRPLWIGRELVRSKFVSYF